MQRTPIDIAVYRYDTETGLYYLQSRYYDPEIGRFINADDVDYLGASGTTLSYNLFAYCENNPVNNIDSDGNVVTILILGIGFTLGEIIGICVGFGLMYLSIRWATHPNECRSFINSANTQAKKIKSYLSKSSQNKQKAKSTSTKKQSKKSGKEKASDVPNWAKRERPKAGESAETFTKRILDEKYGKKQHKKGAGSEYSKIVKWAHRTLGLK